MPYFCVLCAPPPPCDPIALETTFLIPSQINFLSNRLVVGKQLRQAFVYDGSLLVNSRSLSPRPSKLPQQPAQAWPSYHTMLVLQTSAEARGQSDCHCDWRKRTSKTFHNGNLSFEFRAWREHITKVLHRGMMVATFTNCTSEKLTDSSSLPSSRNNQDPPFGRKLHNIYCLKFQEFLLKCLSVVFYLKVTSVGFRLGFNKAPVRFHQLQQADWFIGIKELWPISIVATAWSTKYCSKQFSVAALHSVHRGK